MIDAGILSPGERVELIEGELIGRAFTVSELERMVAIGVIAVDENLELIKGDLVPMTPKYHVHERIKSALILAFAPALPRDYGWASKARSGCPIRRSSSPTSSSTRVP
jgi:hypothetical protein